jgi:TonB family protein
MKSLLTACFFIISIPLFSQKLTVNVNYYDTEEEEVTKDDKWYYYSVDSIFGEEWRTSGYYAESNKVRYTQSPGPTKEPKSRVYYYPSGEPMAKGTIKNGWFVGPISFLRRDGTPFAEVAYPDDNPKYDEPVIISILEYTDSLGNHLVTGGNGSGLLTYPCILGKSEGKVVNGHADGIWKGFSKGNLYEDIYKDGSLVEGSYTKNGTVYHYKKVREMPKPEGGLEALYKHIGRVLKYPTKARRYGIEGIVYIEFIVNNDGTTSDIKTLKGIDSECDAEALKAVETAPRWIPGLYRGEARKMHMILPVRFVLTPQRKK